MVAQLVMGVVVTDTILTNTCAHIKKSMNNALFNGCDFMPNDSTILPLNWLYTNTTILKLVLHEVSIYSHLSPMGLMN